MIATLRKHGKKLTLGGDGRADSPGHSAKYGTYSVMDLDSNKVIDFKIIQVVKCFIIITPLMYIHYNFLQSNEVGGSYHMEKEGLIRVIHFLTENNLSIGVLVTDRHKQINKWLRENHKSISHYYDVWHVVKGLKYLLGSVYIM